MLKCKVAMEACFVVPKRSLNWNKNSVFVMYAGGTAHTQLEYEWHIMGSGLQLLLMTDDLLALEPIYQGSSE